MPEPTQRFLEYYERMHFARGNNSVGHQDSSANPEVHPDARKVLSVSTYRVLGSGLSGDQWRLVKCPECGSAEGRHMKGCTIVDWEKQDA